ncbi:MAG: copper chaperone PCu(A)C, partial [Anaerolineae bacterium]|nr:copper chaperone PCu(A)C [Anaerolineae bacterium]
MLRKLSIALFLMSLMTGASVFSQDADETITVSGAWVRATVTTNDLSSEETPEADMVMGGVSAAYMTIENHLSETIRLYGAESSAASTIEIHETRMQGDVMQMRPVEGGIDIPPGETAVLAPRGLHIMLFDLQQSLIEGEAIQMALNFEILDSSGEAGGETFSQIVGLPILSEPPSPSPLVIQHVWARPASDDSVSAVYMTIYNPGETPERLIGVETAVAELAEIHETRMQGDVMEM